ncbi:MAG: hypothetical protein K8T90_19745 [Planctomycetes bacterium]|nr:hypothetical protein [Planctomycetota bacterium]
MKLTFTFFALAVAVGLAGCAGMAAPIEHHDAAAVAAAVAAPAATLEKMTPTPGYKLTTCLVTDEALDGHGVAYSWQGREVQFCCPGCAARFTADPAKYLAKLDAVK